MMFTSVSDCIEIHKMISEAFNAGAASVTAKGQTSTAFTGTEDSALILELIARGYAVWKPPVGA